MPSILLFILELVAVFIFAYTGFYVLGGMALKPRANEIARIVFGLMCLVALVWVFFGPHLVLNLK